MPYPVAINGSADDSSVTRAGRRVFSPGAGDVRFALTSFHPGAHHIRASKSEDAGLTWAAVDAANEPTIEPLVGETQFDAIIDPSNSNSIIVAWIAPRAAVSQPLWTENGEYTINTFDMISGTWGTPSTGGPPSLYAFGSIAYGVEPYSGIYFNVCKDAADGSCWLSYLTLVDASTADPIAGVGSVMMRPSVIQLSSSGTWGAPILMMAEPAVLANYHPNGICIGDSSRVHVIATRYTMVDVAGYRPDKEWMSVFHQSQLGGALGSVQLVEDHLWGNSSHVGLQNTASPLVTRMVEGSTEILFGYGWTPGDSIDTGTVEEHIARAISAVDPSWGIETLPGISNVDNWNDHAIWCAPVTDGDRLVAYSSYSISGLDFQSNVWFSEYIDGAWAPAAFLFPSNVDANTIGNANYLNLVNGGASVGAVIAAGGTSESYYFEVTLPGSAAINYCF